ncbi:MAG: hypothetical protein HY791_36380 [Deltaproteobacteria bacterium]|nr:hypothetical protein [Deltaproteobacteria bacterium]
MVERTPRTAAYDLLRTGTLVLFDMVESKVEPTVDNEEAIVRLELQMRDEVDEGEEPDPEVCDTVEWGAFGFIFVLATLSFADARPRGYSEKDFQADDEFGLDDFFASMKYVRGALHFYADYVRGRCMKTDIVVRGDGRVTVATTCRGEAALRWVARLQGHIAPVRELLN